MKEPIGDTVTTVPPDGLRDSLDVEEGPQPGISGHLLT